MKNEIIKLAQEKCKEYLKEKSITYHPSYMWLCQYIAKQIYEQMMKDVVEGEVMTNGFYPYEPRIVASYPNCPYALGDKVRIVVLKAEEE